MDRKSTQLPRQASRRATWNRRRKKLAPERWIDLPVRMLDRDDPEFKALEAKYRASSS